MFHLACRSVYVKAVPRSYNGNEAFWHLTLKITTKVKDGKAIKWRQFEKNEPSHAVIGHSSWL